MNKIKWIILIQFLFCINRNIYSQAYSLNSFFNESSAIGFISSDSNNYVYPKITNFQHLNTFLKNEFQYNLNDLDSIDNQLIFNYKLPILGLHNQIPQADSILQEVNGLFILNNKISKWYAYYTQSKIDTNTAFFIIPGSGYHEGFQIAYNNLNDYHNQPSSIKDKCLNYGDVYVYAKPNEDFRSIWTLNTSNNNYMKLNYHNFTSITDLNGNSWALNMLIECTAIIKTLKQKYNKVIVLGLSSGGYPALISSILGKADGVNCASSWSTSCYTGINYTNFEHPFFYSMLNKYNLETVRDSIRNNNSYYLFSYGDSDQIELINYEYFNHSLQDSLQQPSPKCNIEFNYNFVGHHFPVAYLDTFFLKVINDSCNIILSNPSIVNNKSIKIYPNPCKKQNHLYLESENTLNNIEIYSITGELVFQKRNINIDKIDINIKNLHVGNYLVSLGTSNSTINKIITITD